MATLLGTALSLPVSVTCPLFFSSPRPSSAGARPRRRLAPRAHSTPARPRLLPANARRASHRRKHAFQRWVRMERCPAHFTSRPPVVCPAFLVRVTHIMYMYSAHTISTDGCSPYYMHT
ncbi:hypothetical protein DAEQUDRAFT_733240 [Daedalea quercina L-15889]|uniref:Uncharacterized protein n=1 Tax=Daedalea quercina L-15889 TaxID=1314783 RepID=A0A165L588_9APHY|nr:hypothetical protein DAEQUDRAFT_733240 [Daedalea quercina L-15889]